MFKIGDKVKIIGKAPVPVGFQDSGWATGMSEFIGMISTISEIYSGGRYRLKDNSYTWSEVWITSNDNVEEELLLL